MKVHLQKSLRVSAAIAAIALGQMSGFADDASTSDDATAKAQALLDYLQTRVITQTYSTGPWTYDGTQATSPVYAFYPDYGYGCGEIQGTTPDDIIFKNFYLPGLNVDAKLTYEYISSAYTNGYNLAIDISKAYQINSGYASNEYAQYEGKWVKLIPGYKQYDWSYEEGGILTIETASGDEGTNTTRNWAYIRPSEDGETTYSFYLNGDGYCESTRSSASKPSLLFLIYNDEDCTDLVDVKSFIRGEIKASNEANATATDYDKNGNIIRQYKMSFFQNGTSYGFYNLNGKGLSVSLNKATEPSTANSPTNGTSSTNNSNITITDNAQQWDGQLYFGGANFPVTVVNDTKDFKFEGYKKLSEVKGEDVTWNNYSAYWFSYTIPNKTDIVTVSQKADNVYATQLGKQEDPTSKALETFGEYTPDDSPDAVDHNHTTTKCPWVTNQGDRKTYSANANIIFYDYGLAYRNTSNYQVDNYTIDASTSDTEGRKGTVEKYLEEYNRTEILWEGVNKDCTLSVDLSVDQFGSNKDNIYLSGTITPKANVDFVDHYELCIKPGKDTNVNNFPENAVAAASAEDSEVATVNFAKIDFTDCGFPGSKSYTLDQYPCDLLGSKSSVRSYVIKLTDEETSQESETTTKDAASFSMLIPKEASWKATESSSITANSTDSEIEAVRSNYSFYVKAVYKDEYEYDSTTDTGLDPTYHNIVSLDKTTTGVESVAKEGNDVKVFGSQGEISVIGEVNNVAVYSISGALIYNGNSNTISVPTGIYVVKANNTVAKVAVP